MAEPVTELDERFSAPGARATSWAAARAALESAQVSWLSTVRADGRPHVTPLVSVWVDDAAFFCTGPQEQKAVNLAGNPHVVLTTGRDTWDRGLDVMVEGAAVRVTDQKLLTRLAAAWRARWDGSWRYAVADGGFHHEGGDSPVHVYEIRAAKVLAFGKGANAFTHTRHRPNVP